jgi:hypothetical protein
MIDRQPTAQRDLDASAVLFALRGLRRAAGYASAARHDR